MSESQLLPETIIEKAGDLFRKQGYAATTIKQIATAAGCTTAALYYYFAGGKDHLLREVIHRSLREAELATRFPEANSLEEFLGGLSATLVHRLPQMADRLNWILLQFATLPDEEKRIFQDHLRGFQQMLLSQIRHHVADESTADRLAWLICCALFGYQQIFTTMEMGQRVDLSLAEYADFLAQRIGKTCK